jgi:hypothetical protein
MPNEAAVSRSGYPHRSRPSAALGLVVGSHGTVWVVPFSLLVNFDQQYAQYVSWQIMALVAH